MKLNVGGEGKRGGLLVEDTGGYNALQILIDYTRMNMSKKRGLKIQLLHSNQPNQERVLIHYCSNQLTPLPDPLTPAPDPPPPLDPVSPTTLRVVLDQLKLLVFHQHGLPPAVHGA